MEVTGAMTGMTFPCFAHPKGHKVGHVNRSQPGRTTNVCLCLLQLLLYKLQISEKMKYPRDIFGRKIRKRVFNDEVSLALINFTSQCPLILLTFRVIQGLFLKVIINIDRAHDACKNLLSQAQLH